MDFVTELVALPIVSKALRLCGNTSEINIPSAFPVPIFLNLRCYSKL